MNRTTSRKRRAAAPSFDMQALQAGFRGRLIAAGHEAYEERRKLWNGMIDKRPELIAECVGVADVMAGVKYARANRLPVSVRGGGHNVAGSAIADGGVVIDLSRMNAVRVDPKARKARVEGGATLGALDREAQAFGLATPAGVMSLTGVGGLTLHGGLGFLTRKYGLTCDNLVGADVVTADGDLVVASQTSNKDLLWALRGGGGNFGVVTSFEFKLHKVGPMVWALVVMYPAADAPKVLSVFRDVMAKAPNELMAIAIFWSTPNDPGLPAEARAVPTIAIGGCYCGPLDKGEKVLAPLRSIATPLIDMSGQMPFLQLQQLFDPEYPDGRHYYWKSIFLSDLGDGTVADLAASAAARPSPISSLDVWALGGAMSRAPQKESAFEGHRAPFLLGIEANWDNPADDTANVTWARDIYSRMAKRFPGAGSYLNFAGFQEEGRGLLRRSFEVNIARLRRVKAKYDPTNVFRSNLNIAPE